jgi:hypothetical protein
MHALRAVLALSFAILAPSARSQGTGGHATASCPSTPPSSLTPFDSARVADLVGVYNVVLMDTTGIRGVVLKHHGRLTLWQQEIMPSRTGLPARSVPVGQKLLAGAWDASAPDTGAYWRRMAQRDQQSPGVMWAMGFLRMGEFGNGMGISLYVRSSGPTGLHGWWNSGSGMGVTVDFTGVRTRESAGYFCGTRSP